MKRRSFLGLLGLSPLAAKEASSNINLTGYGFIEKTGIAVQRPIFSRVNEGAFPPPGKTYEDIVIEASAYVKAFGAPEFLEGIIEEKARERFHGLDPDIAAKRSWSMSVKIQEQLSRNRQRYRDHLHQEAYKATKMKALEKITGWAWPRHWGW